jgi:hypothetical protein
MLCSTSETVTLTAGTATAAGAIMGTLEYLAPEQESLAGLGLLALGLPMYWYSGRSVQLT